LADEPIRLTSRSADVVVACAIATFVVAETRGTLRLAGVRPAETVRTQIVATFRAGVARSALRFARDAAAKPVPAVEIATLVACRARETLRNTRNTTAESIGAVEVAAVDRRGTSRAFRSADLRGFAQTILAKQVVATNEVGRANLAELAAPPYRVRATKQVELSSARTA
jgi:hypothetical protein